MDQAATGLIQACCRYHHEPLSDSHRDSHAGRDGGHDGGHDGGRGGCGRGRDGLDGCDGRDDRRDSFFQYHLCGQSWYHRLLRRLHRPPWNCLHRPPWSRLHCLPGHGPQRRTRNAAAMLNPKIHSRPWNFAIAQVHTYSHVNHKLQI